MKLVFAEYAGLQDGLWTRVKVKIQTGLTLREGFILFENDGRDIESEGLEDLLQAGCDWLYEDEAMTMLEPIFKLGQKDYEDIQ